MKKIEKELAKYFLKENDFVNIDNMKVKVLYLCNTKLSAILAIMCFTLAGDRTFGVLFSFVSVYLLCHLIYFNVLNVQ